MHCPSWGTHRRSRHTRASRALFPTPIGMASGRVLRQAQRRLRPDSSRRTPVDSHRGVLRRAQGVRQEDARSVQDRVVWRRVYWLCSKTYYCFGATDKSTTKGLNKRQNIIDKDAFLNVLTNRRSGGGFNRCFRVRDSSVMTYGQEPAAPTYFYPKRKVLADGLSTAPLDL